MKKAQTASQIFTYIIAIVVIGIIMLFGYRAVMSFRERGDQVALIQFQKDLDADFQSIANDFGSVELKEYMLSKEYNKVCFVRNYKPVSLDPSDFAGYPLILDSIGTDASGEPLPTQNVFLIKADDEVAEKLTIGQISFSDNSLLKCFPLRSATLSLRMEGMGDHVVLS